MDSSINLRAVIRHFSTWAFLSSFVIGVGLLGCRPSPGPDRTVRIGIQDNAATSLIVIAESEGYFAKHGIQVEIKRYPSGLLALRGLFNDEVDLATCADLPIMVYSFERQDFQVLATIAETSRGAWIIARRDRGIDSPHDLRGKRVGTQANSAVHFFLSMFLLHYGILEAEVELVFMPPGELPTALVDNRIDAFSMRNPFIAEAGKRLGERAVEFQDHSVYRQTFNLVTTRQFIERRGDTLLIPDILKALVDARKLAVNAPERAKRIAVTAYGPEREGEITDDWRRFHFEVGLDQALLLTLEDAANWAMVQGMVDVDQIPDYLDFVHPDALYAVDPAAVTLMGFALGQE